MKLSELDENTNTSSQGIDDAHDSVESVEVADIIDSIELDKIFMDED